jgi:hypothetical protein
MKPLAARLLMTVTGVLTAVNVQADEAPDFSLPAAGPQVVVGGLVARAPPLSAEVRESTRALTNDSRAVHALALQLNPAELQRALADRSRLRALGHDALFLANPDTRDSRKWDPSYLRWDGRTQTLILSPIEKSEAFENFWRMEEAQRGARGRDERHPQVVRLVDALLHQQSSHLFEVHWDNKDDTSFDGLLALDEETGQLRVLMTNDFG